MEYTYIPTGIKRELVRIGIDCNRKGRAVGIVGGGTVAIYSGGHTVFNFPHLECITLGHVRR
jgi:hypothetical protein